MKTATAIRGLIHHYAVSERTCVSASEFHVFGFKIESDVRQRRIGMVMVMYLLQRRRCIAPICRSSSLSFTWKCFSGVCFPTIVTLGLQGAIGLEARGGVVAKISVTL